MRLPNLSNATPRYAYSRTRQFLWERMHPDAPWLTSDAIAFLSQWLKPNDRGAEWGSGRSTIWFARRVGHLISVEHDSDWSKRVREMIEHEDLGARVDYRTFPDGEAESSDTEYVGVADTIDDGSLDFALVDGASRDHCAVAAIPKVRRGGVIVIDNVNWFLPCDSRGPHSLGPEDAPASPAWARFQSETADWNRLWTTNGVWDTALFFRR